MTDATKILLVDTAMAGCGVAYYDAQSGVCHTDYYETSRGQAEHLVPMVQDVLAQGQCGFEDVQAFVVVNGPGTFTGIRIGLSTMRGFVLALDRPLWGISSLQALALGYARMMPTQNKNITAITETKRIDFYIQSFDFKGYATDDARSVLGEDINTDDIVLIGDAVSRFDPKCESAHMRIDLQAVAHAFCNYDERNAFFVPDPQPIYLRAPDVSQPKTPPRICAKI